MVQKLIAIIDDDGGVRDAFSALVEAAGFEVKAFASALEFFDAEVQSALGCLIIDLALPDSDCLAVLDRLSEHDMLPPTIVVTGARDELLIAKAQERNIMALLSKPVQADHLISQVAKALRV